jgi:hypothetical protein
MAEKEPHWDVASMLPDGHRLFPLKGKVWTNVAIADDSGREPQDTDDGILWLDFTRYLTAANSEHACFIPLKSEAGEESTTISNMATLMMLSATFDWPIDDGEGKLYRTYITTGRRPVQATSKEQ